jgi:hypothetical protein
MTDRSVLQWASEIYKKPMLYLTLRGTTRPALARIDVALPVN